MLLRRPEGPRVLLDSGRYLPAYQLNSPPGKRRYPPTSIGDRKNRCRITFPALLSLYDPVSISNKRTYVAVPCHAVYSSLSVTDPNYEQALSCTSRVEVSRLLP